MNFKDLLSVSLILFSVIDIVGSVPILIDLKKRGIRIEAEKASVVAFLLMVAFLYGGEALLRLFGVDVQSFAVAGSIILFLLGLEMILNIPIFRDDPGTQSGTIVPIAFPLIAGANTVRDQWGRPPTLVQPLRVTCSLRLAADSLRLYLLDATGRERSARSYRPGPDGIFRLTLDQAADRTLWYGVEAFYATTSVGGSPPAPIDMRLFPNPARETLWVEYRLPAGRNPIRGDILDAGGRPLQTIDWPAAGDGTQRQTIDVENLPPGTYWLRLRAGERTGVQSWLKQ